MSNLIPLSSLVREFKMYRNTVLSTLKAAGVHPAQSFSSGVRTYSLYEASAARKALAEWVASHRPALAPKPSDSPTPPVEKPLQFDPTPILQSVEALYEFCDQADKRSTERDRQVFKMLESISAQQALLNDAISALRAALSPSGPATEVTVSPQAKPDAEPRATKPVIVVVGLLADQENTIRREFSEVFDLRFIRADAIRLPSALTILRSADHVFTMTRFVSHSVEDVCKSVDVKPRRVPGSLSGLRDAMTNLFVET